MKQNILQFGSNVVLLSKGIFPKTGTPADIFLYSFKNMIWENNL